MYQVDDKPETIHLYVVREEEKKPSVVLPIMAAFLCLVAIVGVIVYSALHPVYEHKTLTIPAQLLPPQSFTAQAAIIPTGVKRYPATYAHGVLSVRNGSIIGQNVPAGFIISGVATERTVYVPGATADGDGYATIPAHVVTAGINLTANAVNVVIGTSLFIHNVQPFTGGRPAYSVTFVTAQDKQMALTKARDALTLMSAGLHYPCVENQFRDVSKMIITWHCQFVTYSVPSYMRILRVRLSGKNLLVDVAFTPPPVRMWVK